ncbi:MAG: hypothetical protein HY906_03940 [Deltaproteobacteria bacterium]|nr:hypothetical protein [Deltaproteobacteria bacterium]
MAKVRDTKPAKKFDQITQVGLKAHALATEHFAVLAERLAAGTVDGLAADLARLGALVPGALAVRADAHAATAAQDQALAAGYERVTAVRTAVARTDGLEAAARKAYAVGNRTNPHVVKDVKAALDLIIARAEANPEEARRVGLLTADLAAMKADSAGVTGADDVQERKRAAAPLTTKERNRTASRVLAGVDRIAGAGVLHFAREAAVRARFEALIGAGNPRTRRAPAPPAPPPR